MYEIDGMLNLLHWKFIFMVILTSKCLLMYMNITIFFTYILCENHSFFFFLNALFVHLYYM